VGVGAALWLCGGTSARGQIFYEPVRAQYASPCGDPCGQPYFYYGGSDPRILDFAARADCRYAPGSYTRGTQLRGSGMQRIPVSPRARIYSDIAPYQDMRDYGWAPADAINEANARQPLYYRRADSPPAGAPGVWVVPSTGEPALQVEPPATPRAAVRAPTATGTILIIPKRLLKPVEKPSDKIVASAK
jgi:hypothetical protein